jgi:hypothetical protein
MLLPRQSQWTAGLQNKQIIDSEKAIEMKIEEGIIDANNPFIQYSWIKQGYGFTIHRQKQISELFGKDKSSILGTNPRNENSYVAFTAIRWGFAEVINGKLTPTEKWTNRFYFDGHGQPLKKI